MNESSRELVRQFLLKRYLRLHTSRIGRAFGWLFDSPEATYVFEHSDCNSERNHCTGEVQRSWFIDREGIREMAIAPDSVPKGRRGMWYRFRRICFHIAPNGDWVVTTEVNGPLAGFGGCSRVVAKGESVDLVAEGNWWRS